jgi:hypothetical protein
LNLVKLKGQTNYNSSYDCKGQTNYQRKVYINTGDK